MPDPIYFHYHRSMQDIFKICFDSGFVVTGFAESCYGNDEETPAIIIVWAEKI